MRTSWLRDTILLIALGWPACLFAQTIEYVDCCDGNGNCHLVKGNRCPSQPAVRRPSPSPDATSTTTTDNYADTERQRTEELQRQREEQLRLAEEEKARKQKEFEDDKTQTLKRMKGLPTESLTIKGAGNSQFFGLKGTSSADAALAIKTSVPDQAAREVTKAWQQIHCAAELAQYALDRAHDMESPNGDTRPLEDEIRYLAKEAANALNGDPVGVQCSLATPIKFTKTPDPAQLAPVYDRLFTRVLTDAQKLNRIRAQREVAEKQLNDAKQRLAEFKSQKAAAPVSKSAHSAAPSPASEDEQIRQAAAEQKQYQLEQQKKINEVYAKQKKQQQNQLDLTELVRRSQAELNKINAQKQGANRDLKAVKDENEGILKGDVPVLPQ